MESDFSVLNDHLKYHTYGSIFSAKSEGRRTIRFRMGHDISSKQYNTS